MTKLRLKSVAVEGGERRRGFLLLFLSVLVAGILMYSPLPGINEYDTVLAAKQFMNRSWIPGDWYLNQHVPYRLPFNLLAGSMVNLFGFIPALILGRLLCLGLFAFGVAKIGARLGVKAAALFPLMIYFVQNQSIFAKEWMVGGFEAKSIAYGLLIIALAFAMEDRFFHAAIFAGSAVSFHVLVGLFGGFCVALSFLVLRWKSSPTPKCYKFGRALAVYLATSVFGLWAVFENLFGADSALAQKAGEIYVRYRVAHHVLPSAWGNQSWLIGIIALLAVFLAMFYLIKDRKARILIGTGIASFGLFAVGAVFYYSGELDKLKYYWFRFPDTFIPFVFTVVIAFLASKLMEKVSTAGKISRVAVVVLAAGACGFGGYSFFETTSEMLKHREWKYSRIEPELGDALLWIYENTPRESRILASPTIEEFYYLAERPMFVSLKHSPQTDEEIIEWFSRILLLTGGETPPEGGIFAYEDWIAEKFYGLNDEALDKIRAEYPFDYYLDKNDGAPSCSVIYENESFRICYGGNSR